MSAGLWNVAAWARQSLPCKELIIFGAKEHLNIFIYDPIAPDPEGIINQGQSNLTARTMQVRQNETINEHVLLNLFKAIIVNNRGWMAQATRGSLAILWLA